VFIRGAPCSDNRLYPGTDGNAVALRAVSRFMHQVNSASWHVRMLGASCVVLSLGVSGCAGNATVSALVAGAVSAPELVGQEADWLNSKPLHMADLRGKVVLVDFWEYTCVNCIRTLPYLKAWNERYKDKGLVIVGIHTPEFEFAKDHKNVADAVKRFGLQYPVLIDSDYRNWQAWENNYWPRKYLIDKNGNVVYDHAGEGGYDQTEAKIQQLLRQVDSKVELPKLLAPVRGSDRPGAVCYPTTPELYAGQRGYENGQVGPRNLYAAGGTINFPDPGEYPDGVICPVGVWRCLSESLRHGRESSQDYVMLRYHASESNAVIKPEQGKPFRLYLMQDGAPISKLDAGRDVRFESDGRSYIDVDHPGMFSLTVNRKHGEHVLRMTSDSADFGLYSFTFSSCEVAPK
jgi:thiol-disulfide isomerase/thioredoxin